MANMLKLLFIFGIFALTNAQLHRITLQQKPNYVKSMGNVRAERHQIMAKHGVQVEDGTIECVEELDNHINNLFTGQVAIGTPPQYFNAIFDTGSSALYVQRECDNDSNDNINQILCSNTNGYNASASSTSYGSEVYYSLYPDSLENETMEIEAQLMQDVVRVAGMELQSISFSAGEYKVYASEMLFGLSVNRQTGDASQYYPTIYYMKQQGYINQLVFSLYMPPIASGLDGQIMFGGLDAALYNGSLTYLQVHDQLNWTITVHNAYINDITVSLESRAQIDSTFGLIGCPIYAFARISQQLNGTYDNEGNYFLNCATIDQLPAVYFNLSGNIFELTYNDYILHVNGTTEQQTKCMSAFSFINTDFWVFGIPFLTRYYTEFDITNKRLGLAAAIW